MPRPRKKRKVIHPPKMHGFQPFGIALCNSEKVLLHFDEFESIKLVNYDNLSQEDAAVSMDISRPTLTRIYNKALRKIAQAFVEGRSIIIEGGNYKFDKDWFKCQKCHKLIEGIENHLKCAGCNRFGQDELISLAQLNND